MAAAMRNRKDRELEEVPLQVTVPRRVKRELDLMAASAGRTKRSIVLEALRAVGIHATDAEVEGRRSGRRGKSEKKSDD